MANDTFKTLKEFTPSPGKTAKYHNLAVLEAAGLGGAPLPGKALAADVERTLPVSSISAVRRR